MRYVLPIFLVLAVAVPLTALPLAAAAPNGSVKRKPDLADAVAGTFTGKVTANSRGSSGTEVAIVVKRVGKNLIEVSCDYTRVPTVRIALMRSTNTILYASGQNVFIIDRDKDPRRLDLSIDGVAMLVYRS